MNVYFGCSFLISLKVKKCYAHKYKFKHQQIHRSCIQKPKKYSQCQQTINKIDTFILYLNLQQNKNRINKIMVSPQKQSYQI